jgi:putative iron-only hydrogenase system regulator
MNSFGGYCAGKAGYSIHVAGEADILLHRAIKRKEIRMETRVALIGIIVEDLEAAEKLNGLLHEYGQYIIGRMGLPYREKNISIISVVINAEADIISTLAGKLGMIKGVNVKTIYSKK